jgi:phosphoglycolate phosphatase-like HAD superfamily hydrolase
MFIIDFDDTLFDTQRYHRARYEAVADLGISPEVYWQAYSETRLDSEGNFIYNDDRHSDSLGSKGFDSKEVAARFKLLAEKMKDFLFPDAHDFLNDIKKFGAPMFLLTWGCPEFQRFGKVEPSGIAHYFDEVFYTRAPKERHLKDFFEKNEVDKTWFINDKPEETVRLSKQFTQLKPILKFSPLFSDNDYKNLGIPYFRTLTEIKEYVFKQSK